MPTQASAPRDGTVIAHGYGLKIYVHHGHLVVHDGVGRDRRTRRFNRATGKLKRLVVLGHTGYVTLDAFQWLKQTGAALIQLDHHGDLVALSGAQAPNLPQLRRAQALAATSTAGIEVARLVLGEKLRGQQAVAAHMLHGDASTAAIGAALEQLVAAAEFDELLGAEAAAANAYWTPGRLSQSGLGAATTTVSRSTGAALVRATPRLRARPEWQPRPPTPSSTTSTRSSKEKRPSPATASASTQA